MCRLSVQPRRTFKLTSGFTCSSENNVIEWYTLNNVSPAMSHPTIFKYEVCASGRHYSYMRPARLVYVYYLSIGDFLSALLPTEKLKNK